MTTTLYCRRCQARRTADTLRQLRNDATPHLAAIHEMFVAESKILVVVVFPDTPEQNWCLGNATLEEAQDGLTWLAQHGEDHGHA